MAIYHATADPKLKIEGKQYSMFIGRWQPWHPGRRLRELRRGADGQGTHEDTAQAGDGNGREQRVLPLTERLRRRAGLKAGQATSPQAGDQRAAGPGSGAPKPRPSQRPDFFAFSFWPSQWALVG